MLLRMIPAVSRMLEGLSISPDLELHYTRSCYRKTPVPFPNAQEQKAIKAD
jgi:hypothetical protein